MSSLSIRGVDEQLSKVLKRQAKKAKKSVNQFVLETLRTHVGLKKEKRFTKEYDDLDHLFGCWSESEFGEIQDKITAERRIDPELWSHGE